MELTIKHLENTREELIEAISDLNDQNIDEGYRLNEQVKDLDQALAKLKESPQSEAELLKQIFSTYTITNISLLCDQVSSYLEDDEEVSEYDIEQIKDRIQDVESWCKKMRKKTGTQGAELPF